MEKTRRTGYKAPENVETIKRTRTMLAPHLSRSSGVFWGSVQSSRIRDWDVRDLAMAIRHRVVLIEGD